MPDGKLELDLYDLQAEVGDYAGFGVGARFGDKAWNADQVRRITKSVHSGCRMVYYTQSLSDPNGKPIDDIPAGYMWSWRQPRITLAIPEGADEIPLPRDFEGFVDDIIPASTGTAQWPVRIVDYGAVYRLRAQSPSQTGRPMYAAEQIAQGVTPTQGSRSTLQVYPTTDAAYTLQLWVELAPGPLTDEFPVPYGGAALAETFKAAVRSAYEQDFDNKRDVETARFVERLRAAIAADRKHKPLHLGYNGDRSDSVDYLRPLQHGSDWGVPFTVNGVEYA
jgi:hypothetical protein